MANTKARRLPKKAPQTRSRWRGPTLVAIGAVVAIVIVAIAVSAQHDTASSTTVVRDPDTLARGEVLFVANCAACHGADLQGTDSGPPFLDAIYAPNHHADEAFQRAAALGVGAHHWNFGDMPPRPGLTREDVAAIVAFVRIEQEAAGIFRDPSHP